MISAILLDFDGVLVESVDIKTEAFRTLFSFSPSHVDEIVHYHLNNAGISRFEKFRHIYENILHEHLTDEQSRHLSDRFSSLVIDAVAGAPYVGGAERFLSEYCKKVPLYVISATPEQELKQIITRKGMEHFFRGIYGSPKRKAENLKILITTARLSKANTLYVGDAINDLNAARQAGVRFIGRIRPGIADPFIGCAGVEKTVRDLDELSQYIGGLL
jgi:HAD superfamily hydrolase (TIGR01549 family)